MSNFHLVPRSPAPLAIQHNQQGTFFGGNAGVHQQQQQQLLLQAPAKALLEMSTVKGGSSIPHLLLDIMQALMRSSQSGIQGLAFGHHQ